MGLDLYVGSLTRYFAGDWKTVTAQAAEADGIEFITHRPNEPEHRADPGEIQAEVARWQAAVAEALGLSSVWVDRPDAPYATDQPGWPGYGAVVLLACRLERPDLASDADSPESFTESRAFEAVRASESRFPSLIGGAEWWLPTAGLKATFTGNGVDGTLLAMATLDQLLDELEALREGIGAEPAALNQALLTGGPDRSSATVDRAAYLHDWGLFGLAVFLELARQAQHMNLPLLMDY